MATRGTGILLTSENVLLSTEFNGDMYPCGYGDMFFNKLSKVKNKEDFIDFVVGFNDEIFQYDDEILVYEEQNHKFYSAKSTSKLVDLSEVSNDITSDWIFIKNIQDEVVFIECFRKRNQIEIVEVNPGETVRFHFDEIPKKDILYKI